MNRKALIKLHNISAAELIETDNGYEINYLNDYSGEPISLTLHVQRKSYFFQNFPPFLDGLLPEGIMLEILLKIFKLDADDYFGQLLTVGSDLVGAITVKEIKE